MVWLVLTLYRQDPDMLDAQGRVWWTVYGLTPESLQGGAGRGGRLLMGRGGHGGVGWLGWFLAHLLASAVWRGASQLSSARRSWGRAPNLRVHTHELG